MSSLQLAKWVENFGIGYPAQFRWKDFSGFSVQRASQTFLNERSVNVSQLSIVKIYSRVILLTSQNRGKDFVRKWISAQPQWDYSQKHQWFDRFWRESYFCWNTYLRGNGEIEIFECSQRAQVFSNILDCLVSKLIRTIKVSEFHLDYYLFRFNSRVFNILNFFSALPTLENVASVNL